MDDLELDDGAEQLQNPKTAHAFPLGVKLLFAGLIVWGICYLFLYSPWSTGWTQERDLQGASTAVNVLQTIAYTAIPAAVAVVLAVAMARRRKASR